jgi:hypothetical protein
MNGLLVLREKRHRYRVPRRDAQTRSLDELFTTAPLSLNNDVPADSPWSGLRSLHCHIWPYAHGNIPSIIGTLSARCSGASFTRSHPHSRSSPRFRRAIYLAAIVL